MILRLCLEYGAMMLLVLLGSLGPLDNGAPSCEPPSSRNAKEVYRRSQFLWSPYPQSSKYVDTTYFGPEVNKTEPTLGCWSPG